MGFGDRVERALKLVGVTPETVAPFLGPDCGCDDRRERLNEVGWWAERVLRGRTENAAAFLRGIIGDRNEEQL